MARIWRFIHLPADEIPVDIFCDSAYTGTIVRQERGEKMREKFHGVPMLPFGILAGFAEEREIRLTDLAEEGFRFRTAEKTEEPGKFRLCFYNSLAGGYREMELTDFEMEEEEHTSFFYIYVVYTESETYRKEVRRLIGQYSRYIRLKLMEDDGELAKALTGYPAEKDLVEACSLEEQKRRWFSELPVVGYFRSFHRWPWSWTGRNSTGSISPWRSGNFPPGTGLPMAWENIRWPEEPLTASTSEIPSVIFSFRKKASSLRCLKKPRGRV